MVIVVSPELENRIRSIARTILRTPFIKRTWSELWFFAIGTALAFVGIALVGLTMAAGVVFAITFFGLAIMAFSIRSARGIGGLQRRIARAVLAEHIEEPDPFVPRPGFLGWLQSALRDRTGWTAMAYILVKVPLAFVGVLVAFSVWFDAFTCLTYRITGSSHPPVFGVVRLFFHAGNFSIEPGGLHGVATFLDR